MYKYLNLLTVFFILLKVAGLAEIAWWQVFIPTYTLLGILLFWLVLLLITSLIIYLKER